MKVSNIGFNLNSTIENKDNKVKGNFSSTFNQTNKFKTEEELQNYIGEIKSIGNKILVTQNYNDVLSYKKAIKTYLKSVVDYMYSTNKDTSFWKNDYFTTVNTVNEKLEDITRAFINDQKENIDIASKIDEINGLLIDVYM